jgi:CBS domain-containing protein
MKIKEIMQKKIIKISKGTPYKKVAKILKQNRISGAPVIDENNNMIGVVSEKDIFRVMYPEYKDFYETPEAYQNLEDFEKEIVNNKDKLVEEFMTKDVVSVSPDDPIIKAASIIMTKGIHRVPVVEDGKLVGIVSRRDIYHTIFTKYLKI